MIAARPRMDKWRCKRYELGDSDFPEDPAAVDFFAVWYTVNGNQGGINGASQGESFCFMEVKPSIRQRVIGHMVPKAGLWRRPIWKRGICSLQKGDHPYLGFYHWGPPGEYRIRSSNPSAEGGSINASDWSSYKVAVDDTLLKREETSALSMSEGVYNFCKIGAEATLQQFISDQILLTTVFTLCDVPNNQGYGSSGLSTEKIAS
ncbi:hypothetical protein [Absidia glauca]|uniref:Uncharacterized protein n=1 Tax=Absidia glauca TaxID=4829 RepID=A0A168KKI5_ABSGL|nr:hypothetical protein [Absidia glauca]